ncbi:hypothetical protein IKF04_04215 [Candidatus Saccharibacteria bacterium]|nr:hypothetical protein [Candidatus Saccharibacteria bacterium]
MLGCLVKKLLQNEYPEVNGRSDYQSVPGFVLLFAVLSFDRTGELTSLLNFLLPKEGKYSLEQKTATEQILSLASKLYDYVEFAGQEDVYARLAKRFPERSSEWQNGDPEKQVRAVIEQPIKTIIEKVASYIDLELLLKAIEANSSPTPANKLNDDEAMIRKIVGSLSWQLNNDETWSAPEDIREYISGDIIEAAKKVFKNRLGEGNSTCQSYEDKIILPAITITCYGFCDPGIIAVLRVIRENKIELTSSQKRKLVEIMLQYCSYSKAEIFALLQSSLRRTKRKNPKDRNDARILLLARIVNTLDAEDRLGEVLTEANLGESGPDELNNEQYNLFVKLLKYSSEFYYVAEIVGRDKVIKALQTQANFKSIKKRIDEVAFTEYFDEVLRYTTRYIDMKKFLRAILSMNNTTTKHDENNALFGFAIKLNPADAVEFYLEDHKEGGVYTILQAIKQDKLDTSKPEISNKIVQSLHTQCGYQISVLLRIMTECLNTPE